MGTRPCQLKSFADDTVTMPSAAGRVCSRYGEIDVPVRLIAGVNDKVVSTHEQSERLNRNLKDCELQLLEGVGHMSHHSRPDLVVAAVEGLSNAAKHQTPEALNNEENPCLVLSDLICLWQADGLDAHRGPLPSEFRPLATDRLDDRC